MRKAQEVYIWMQGIIDSCTSDFHFDAVDVLIELFVKRHPEEMNLINGLQSQRQERWNAVHSILV